MNIIQLMLPTYLRLDSGIVRDPGGEQHGKRIFWLEFVEGDGGTFNIWQGESYEEALAEAKDSLDRGMRFENLVGLSNFGGAA